MGRFDGILICSDWDGTLFDGRTVPKGSVEAIKYFQKNGGKFTLCSGRAPFYMKDMLDYVHPNTYALALNGAIICDLDTNVTVSEAFVDGDAYRLAEALMNCGIRIKRMEACIKGESEYYWASPEDFTARIPELKDLPIYKVTVTCEDPADGDRLMEFAAGLDTGKYSILRSGKGYAEIFLTEYSKGNAARRLKEMICAELLVCMGDYENDLPMFRLADVSYAVGNAIPALKEIATHRIDTPVQDCAVAKIIEDIEKRYAK